MLRAGDGDVVAEGLLEQLELGPAQPLACGCGVADRAVVLEQEHVRPVGHGLGQVASAERRSARRRTRTLTLLRDGSGRAFWYAAPDAARGWR